ncbi:TonB-dependent receptor [Thalassotalea sp. PLHSN55]|uniref:TonB-dependent receptor n=1 Tax=Thalassotalea sp. PLHSN55 TaxID=3435888 RepID=UPI003F83A753
MKFCHLVLCSLAVNLSAKAENTDTNNQTNTPNNTPTEHFTIEGRGVNLIGEAVSASEGLVGQEEISVRPLLRTGEILELVPGMVVTQHSGTGKANQYFLRGFNLDHGTDFSTYIDDMPINMRSHGHGQGYTDLNFIIPETIKTISYQKGAYYAEVGDFSGAGNATMKTANKVENGLVTLTAGENGYGRIALVDSVATSDGEFLYGLEYNQHDGPWTNINEDLDKKNLLLKYSSSVLGGDYSVTFMGYDNSWDSADQIPSRAVENGTIDEFGSIDDTVGGISNRYSISSNWSNDDIELALYAVKSELNLWSNFTYLLDNPIDGDQFEQVDDRTIYGGKANYQQNGALANLPMNNLFGVEFRYDDIDEVALYQSKQRQRIGVTRADKVGQLSTGIYWQNQLELTENLRSTIGVRYDYFDFDVHSLVNENSNGVDLTANNGKANDGIVSVKANLSYSLSDELETYVSIGQAFHSNDARGVTINVSPIDGTAADSVDALVASLGYEFGIRGFWQEKLNASASLWYLELDSELLFVGDAGNTEPSRKSDRYGLELTACYHLDDVWTLDLEYAYTDAEFTDNSPDGNYIPGSVDHVVQAGVVAEFDNGLFGTLRMRYFGERPLIEDNSVTSDATFSANLRLGYQFNQWKVTADVLNLFDSNDHDIDYYYESNIPTDPQFAAVSDVHYHPLEPRSVRVSLSTNF